MAHRDWRRVGFSRPGPPVSRDLLADLAPRRGGCRDVVPPGPALPRRGAREWTQSRESVPPETAERRAEPVLGAGAPGTELVAGRGPHRTFGTPAGETLHDRQVQRRAVALD